MFLKYKTIYNTVKKERKKASSSSSILGLRRTNTNQSNKIMCIVACFVCYILLDFLYIMKGFTTQKKKRKTTKIANLSAPLLSSYCTLQCKQCTAKKERETRNIFIFSVYNLSIFNTALYEQVKPFCEQSCLLGCL